MVVSITPSNTQASAATRRANAFGSTHPSTAGIRLTFVAHDGCARFGRDRALVANASPHVGRFANAQVARRDVDEVPRGPIPAPPEVRRERREHMTSGDGVTKGVVRTHHRQSEICCPRLQAGSADDSSGRAPDRRTPRSGRRSPQVRGRPRACRGRRTCKKYSTSIRRPAIPDHWSRERRRGLGAKEVDLFTHAARLPLRPRSAPAPGRARESRSPG
jgi:hypothetical protein